MALIGTVAVSTLPVDVRTIGNTIVLRVKNQGRGPAVRPVASQCLQICRIPEWSASTAKDIDDAYVVCMVCVLFLGVSSVS